MPFQWLTMRISEENDRRQREANVLERLPRALEEVRQLLNDCVEDYQKAFGEDAVEIAGNLNRVRITVRELQRSKWEPISKIEVNLDLELPGFRVDRAGKPLTIEVGLLPGDRLFYRDIDQDQYVNPDELTRRILDRGFFPKLPE